MSHAIEIEAVSKRYGQLQALDRVSFAVEPGEFFALLGPNGAGKTTLISALAGLARPDSGSIRVMGRDVVRDFRDARRALGVVPQELVFDPFLSVRETLRFQSGYFGLARNEAWIDELLFKLGLADKADSNMRALSGGMKRRVMVAQALVHRPPVVVLDEPTAGVDVELRQSLWTFVQELNRAGTTIVLTTHYLEEAEALCGRIAMLKKGRLLALENKDKLLAHSARREVAVKLSGPLPDSLLPRKLRDDDGRAVLQLADLSELEGVLAELRLAGVEVRELNVVEADLESVFVKMMNGGAA
ncbi:ABC transporter ATP-binding protein [Chromobacterium vaccinii]|uniref:ABC transporter ATP-binding protein n=2 Tax=Chromobacterium TaxID=535 RepID=A0ABV0FBG9_9NEIS|nr:ABC transporter ATP-binding protein [Chromobacterium vaccinii]AVG18562.1 ABC transporter ATP-binding protein [Chromobacterium vaccinii]MCD4483444.1 ABC transporter ATP-binding protein [Chromobacterium vaccinii]MCD4502047.1 ABC transporter ATP-binding protein [Chromobacterium vaccinii]